jgi:hypothetical protein
MILTWALGLDARRPELSLTLSHPRPPAGNRLIPQGLRQRQLVTIRHVFHSVGSPVRGSGGARGALNFDLRFLSGVLIAANVLGNPVLLS